MDADTVDQARHRRRQELSVRRRWCCSSGPVSCCEASPTPVTFLAVPPLLVLAATLACFLPARRAARVDPVIALRAE